MINTAEIEAGDKVHLRDGSVLVAWTDDNDNLRIGADYDDGWETCGARSYGITSHRHDIIRIEKAPKPVVETYWLCLGSGLPEVFITQCKEWAWFESVYKITITDGEATIERVK